MQQLTKELQPHARVNRVNDVQSGVNCIVSTARPAWRKKCNRCYKLARPANHMPVQVKERLFEHYPIFVKTWAGRSETPIKHERGKENGQC